MCCTYINDMSIYSICKKYLMIKILCVVHCKPMMLAVILYCVYMLLCVMDALVKSTMISIVTNVFTL